MSVIADIEDGIKLFKKYKKSPILFLIIIILIWALMYFIGVLFDDDIYRIEDIKINIILGLILSLITIIVMIIYNKNYYKNKSGLLGVGFLISCADIEKENVVKNDFIRSLKNELYGSFNILIYSDKELKKYIKKNNSYKDILKKLNLFVLFEVKERSGYIENDNHYEIEIIRTHIAIPYELNYRPINNISDSVIGKDFTDSLNKTINISKKNSFLDSKEEISMLQLYLLYIKSFFEIYSKNPELSFKTLDDICGILKATKINKNEYSYISKNIKLRYVEAYEYSIIKEMNISKYYKNKEKTKLINYYLDELINILFDYKNELPKKDFKIFYANYIIQKSIVTFDEKKYEEALNIINLFDFTLPESYIASINKAFLLMMNNRITESVRLYKKLLERIIYPPSIILDILKFIEERSEDDKDNNRLQFCYAIINYYAKDKKLALKMFEDLINKDTTFKNEIDYIMKKEI